MIAAPSAVWPIDKALAAAFKANAALSARLAGAKVYSGMAPTNSALPYIVLGTSAEDPFRLFKRAGMSGSTQFQVWTLGPDKRATQEIYSLAKQVLDSQVLALEDGLLMLRGSCRLIGVLPGDVAAKTYRAIAVYEWVTVLA